MDEGHNSLNASQRQRLLTTCKHIDKLLSDVEATLNAATSNSVFPMYRNDITPVERTAIEGMLPGFALSCCKCWPGSQ